MLRIPGTGTAGFVGRHLVRRRLEVSDPVHAVDRVPATLAVAQRCWRTSRPGTVKPRFLAVGLAALYALGASPIQPSRAQTLAEMYRITDDASGTVSGYKRVDVPRGKEFVLADLKGPGKVTYFYVSGGAPARLCPGLLLKAVWDDEAQPSILVPLWDFFGAMGGASADYQSAPMQINHLCFMCYMPMPFSRRAQLVLTNDGDMDYSQVLAYGLDYEKGGGFAEERSRLHCTWRRSNPTRDSMHTLLEATGRGHYVGNFLRVRTKYDAWWGEGDTIFHIDGQAATHSTGTEDEYGSCFGFGPPFSNLYSGHEQLRGGDHRMYRWYLVNPVRFQKSLKVEIQNQHWEKEKGQVPAQDDYISVAFWYQEEPHAKLTLQPFAERIARSRAADYKSKP